MKTVRVALDLIVPDPDQPRKLFESGEITALAENMKTIGQQIQVIVWQENGKAVLLDGERRWRAAKIAGIPELLAIVLPAKPSKAELRIIQHSIDAQKVPLNPMEQSNNLAEIMREKGWGVGELAEHLSKSQPACSRLLAYQKLAPAVKELLATGQIKADKAYELSKIEDHAVQIEMAKQAVGVNRDEFKAKVKKKDKPVVKATRAVFALPGGGSITFKGPEATGEEVVGRLKETVKQLLKLFSQGHDIASCQRVMNKKAT
jgi:ParB family chromosome partitioning protein